MKRQFEEILQKMNLDRAMAARMIFPHRHSDKSPEYHSQIDELWRSVHPKVVLEVFRGGAKTTKSEEFALLEALFQSCHYILLVGESYEKACQSLYNIKSEIKKNEIIRSIWGDMEGDTWRENEIVLSNGVKLQAVGQDQEQRGFKHGHHRPDRIIIDDVEKRSMILNQKYRESIWTWIFSEILPALDPKEGKVRVIGTSLHPHSLVARLIKDPAWVHLVVPIEKEGSPAWPSRFSLEWIKKTKEEFQRAGQSVAFLREFMCLATDEANRSLDHEALKRIPEETAPHHLPKLIAIDPARTVKDTSDKTGVAVGAWSGTKLYLFKTYGKRMRPDEIIQEAFKLETDYSPISLGIETNSLEEFIMQPMRAEMLRRRTVLPIQDLRAPGNKGAFIMGLQPFIEAGEVILVGDHPDLIEEMQMYPGGNDDVLNAVAYLMLMRGGKPVYEDFNPESIGSIDVDKRMPLICALNNQGSLITGVLLQTDGAEIAILRDWITYDLPEDALKQINAEVRLSFPNNKLNYFVPGDLHEKWAQNPLVGLLKKEVGQGAYISNSRGSIADYTRIIHRGRPALAIDPRARWTINAISGGYQYEVSSTGQTKTEPKQNEYRTLMEGLESVVKSLDNMTEEDHHYSISKDGRRYLSTIAA